MKTLIVTRTVSVITAFAIALFLLLLITGAIPVQVKASSASAPASTVFVGSQVFAAIGITQTYTGTAIYLPSYTADCYATYVLTGAQGIQLALQHSPNNSTWVTLAGYTPSAVTHTVDVTTTTTTVAFSPSLTFYGTWIRGIATLTGTTPVNTNIICTFHP